MVSVVSDRKVNDIVIATSSYSIFKTIAARNSNRVTRRLKEPPTQILRRKTRLDYEKKTCMLRRLYVCEFLWKRCKGIKMGE